MTAAGTPQVAFDIIAKNLADRVLAEVQTSLVGVANEAKKVQAPVGGAQSVLMRLGVSAGDAKKGMNLLEAGMRGMTLQATGVPGPLGAIARGVLQLGVGSPWIIAGIAGAAAFGLAWQHAGKDAREAAAELIKLRDANAEALAAQNKTAGVAAKLFGTNKTDEKGVADAGAIGATERARQRVIDLEGDLALAREAALDAENKAAQLDVTRIQAELVTARDALTAANQQEGRLRSELDEAKKDAAKKKADDTKKASDDQAKAAKDRVNKIQEEFDATKKLLDLDPTRVELADRLLTLNQQLTAELAKQKTIQAELQKTEADRATPGGLSRFDLTFARSAGVQVPTFGQPGPAGNSGPSFKPFGQNTDVTGNVFRELRIEQLARAEQALADRRKAALDVIAQTTPATIRYADVLEELREMERAGIITKAQLAAAQKKLTKAEEDSAVMAELAAAQMLSAFGNLAAGLARGGGAGGFLSSAGGFLGILATLKNSAGAALIPHLAIPAALLGALGGIASAFEDRKSRDPMPVRIDDFSSRAADVLNNRDTRPEIYVIKIEGQANPEEVIAQLARASRSDRSSRIPRAAQGGSYKVPA